MGKAWHCILTVKMSRSPQGLCSCRCGWQGYVTCLWGQGTPAEVSPTCFHRMCSGHTDNYPGCADGSLVSEESSAKNGKACALSRKGQWFCAQESVSCGEAWGKACGQTVQPSCPPLRTRPDGEDGHGSRQADDSDRTKTQRLSTFLFNL